MSGTRHLNQLFTYGALGLVGTASHYLVLYLLVEIAGLAILISSSAGFVTGAIINHELNRRFLFHRTQRSYGGSAVRFFLVAAAGFIVNLSVMYVLTIVFSTYYLVAQVAATGLVFLATFLVNKLWTFQA
ncbi:GtrA family protein [Marinobacter panjinensis]|nr:GtrA family protein [Marinobacter panjinensis]MCR8915804.1 GtrA family protein [Marinobacter panjinensis]